jgi:uncharacterized protein
MTLRIVDRLSDPDAYPYTVDSVDLIQTHISWVFLAGPFVYKVKKPVDFGFVDYTTLDRRRFYCHEEVRLNSRLAPDVYLGVVPIARREGAVRVEGSEGEVVEYAVKMRRLSQDRMLDQLLLAGAVSAADVRRLAERIARFHELAGTNENVSRFGSQEAIHGNWQENFEQVRPYLGETITHDEYERCRRFVRDQLERRRPLFARRLQEGQIRDCHGDLRAESVWMAPDGAFQIYDCIEFNERLRYGDVASEVAFLASDLDRRGRPDLAWEWATHYTFAAGDRDLMTLLPFYKCYRAFVRGKVESLTADQPGSSTHRQAARERFRLADLYTTKLPPTVFITCGQVGSGKSTLAHGLASLLGLPVLSSDAVRKELAGMPAEEHRPGSLDTGLYEPDARRAVYDELYRRGGEALSMGGSIILDATFSRQEERSRAAALARDHAARFVVLWAELPEALIRERLARRVADATSLSDAGPEIYDLTQSRFEAPAETASVQVHRVDMSRPVGDAVSEAAWSIRRRMDERLYDQRLPQGAGLP